MEIKVKTVNISTNELPTYATTGSAGMDLRANLLEAVILKPMERTAVSTGLFLEIPHGYEGQVRPRSGLALKQGLTVLNTPGTIDSDYKGEVKVILLNLSSEPQTIKHGERIAQLVFSAVSQAELVVGDVLSLSDRGHGGFGHTGKQ